MRIVTSEGFVKPQVLYINEKDGNTNTAAHKVKHNHRPVL